jgi:hypothetical protein
MLRPLMPARVEVREVPHELTNLPVHQVMERVRQLFAT